MFVAMLDAFVVSDDGDSDTSAPVALTPVKNGSRASGVSKESEAGNKHASSVDSTANVDKGENDVGLQPGTLVTKEIVASVPPAASGLSLIHI